LRVLSITYPHNNSTFSMSIGTADAWHQGVEYLLYIWTVKILRRAPAGHIIRPNPRRISSPKFFDPSSSADEKLRS
jgi:hypothetical protein